MTHLFLYFYRRKWLGLLTMILLLAIAIPFALKLKVDLDFMRLLETRSQTLHDIAKMKKTKSYVIFRLTAKHGDFLNQTTLSEYKQLVKSVHLFDSSIQVKSILDLHTLEHHNGKLVSLPLIKAGELSEVDRAAIRKRIHSSYPLIKDFISKDLKVTSMLVSYKADNRTSGFRRYVEINNFIRMHANKFHEIKDMSLYKPRVYDWRTTTREVPLLSLLMVFVLIIIIGLLTRNIIFSGILIIVIFFNLVLSAAFMGAMGLTLNLISLILPFLVIVVGSTEVVHMLCAYVKGMRRHNLSSAKAAVYMVKQVAWPCVLTGFTTSIGVYSLGFSSYIASQHAGLAGGTAMLICGLSSLFMLPMLLAFIPSSMQVDNKDRRRMQIFTWVREGFVDFIMNRELWVFIVLAIMLATSAFYITRVTYDFVTDNMYVKDHVYSRQLAAFRKDFGGMGRMVVKVTGPKEGAFLQKNNLFKVMRLVDVIQKNKIVSSTASFADAAEVAYSKMYEKYQQTGVSESGMDPSSFFEKKNITSLSKFVDTSDGQKLISPDFRKMSIFIRYKINNVNSVLLLKDSIEHNATTIFGKDYKVNVSYSNQQKYEIIDMVFAQGVRSYIFCLLVIFIMFCLMYKSIRMGLLALVPNLFAVVLLFGYMGMRGIFLNPVTFTCFQFMLTIGVDFTIHLYIRYDHEKKIQASSHAVSREVVRDLVGPLFISTVAVFLPLFIGTHSSNVVLARYSELISMGLFFSFISNILISPLIFKRLKYKNNRLSEN